jgi:hypothetical protein
VRRLCIAVVFNRDKNRKHPRLISVLIQNKIYHFDLYRESSLKTLKQIKADITKIRELIIKANDKGHEIVCQDFRDLVETLELPIDQRDYNVYDMHLPKQESNDCIKADEQKNSEIIDVLVSTKVKLYQKVLANSSVVYADLERSGLMYNYTSINPKWSQKTYTGRSKSLEFNIQGLATQDIVGTVFGKETDVLIHFDWVCADIRIASIMSGDDVLSNAFIKTDPYTMLSDILNKACEDNNSESTFSRDECKLILLKGINSLDFNSVVFDKAFPKLGTWIFRLSDKDAMTSIMGRIFRMTDDKTKLSVFNGVMQGSVAHAMQIVMRKLWEKMGSKIVCDIHDSIVVSCPADQKEISMIIDQVCEIMLRPFAGILNDDDGEDFRFPVKVSIGKKWKSYKYLKTVYNNDK